MITFTCEGCGRSFSVPDQYAGKKAKCKSCGASVQVPTAGAAVEMPAAVSAGAAASAGPAAPSGAGDGSTSSPNRIPMRLRRLRADADQMAAAFADFPVIRILETRGDPPEVYKLEYHVRSLDRPTGRKQTEPVPRETHVVEIQLTSEYPRQSPKCRMLTPIFHPNIDPATICVGDHWTAGERLVDLAIRIAEMLGYQAYNIKSPLDAEAAMWADLNADKLPTDARSMRPAE